MRNPVYYMDEASAVLQAETIVQHNTRVTAEGICGLIYGYAHSYIAWVVGSGGDLEAIRSLQAIEQVFISHFMEWAENLSYDDLCASLPQFLKDWTGAGTSYPYPKIVAQGIAMAQQWDALKDSPNRDQLTDQGRIVASQVQSKWLAHARNYGMRP